MHEETSLTALDAAHRALADGGGDDALHMHFYACLADGELFLLLEQEVEGDQIIPQVFDLDEGRFVLAFDNEERLAAFSGGAAPYGALPGRVLASMLRAQNIGLGVNLGVAPSSMLLPPEAMDWLSETLEHAPQELEAIPAQFSPPGAVPRALSDALSGALMRSAGLADTALLARVLYKDGRNGHMLAFVGARPKTEAALARAISDALVFSGLEAGVLDVTFMEAGSPSCTALARVARRFDLPKRDTPPAPRPPSAPPSAPGMDPKRPPKLN